MTPVAQADPMVLAVMVGGFIGGISVLLAIADILVRRWWGR